MGTVLVVLRVFQVALTYSSRQDPNLVQNDSRMIAPYECLILRSKDEVPCGERYRISQFDNSLHVRA